jgi:dTDP-glucose 4,6-dehydratase
MKRSIETLLVTGGCGFIGSNFIRHMLTASPAVKVVNFDALTYAGSQANVSDVAHHPHYRMVHGDICDRDAVRSVMQTGIDSIINFAAETHVDRSIREASLFVRTNVLGTQVLLDVSREFRVRRFVQISTDEVYGSLGPTGAFTEETPLAPTNPYSASKASADLLVRSYMHTHGVPALITRCSNNYGPYQSPEKLVPLFITNLLKDKPVPIYGDGRQVRDWIDVRDHCAAIERVWRRGRIGEIYNVGGRCERTNLELTYLLLELLGKPRLLIRHVSDRPGHDRRYAMDCSKIEQELGWRPQRDLESGLREVIAWYQANVDWVSQIRVGPTTRSFSGEHHAVSSTRDSRHCRD